MYLEGLYSILMFKNMLNMGVGHGYFKKMKNRSNVASIRCCQPLFFLLYCMSFSVRLFCGNFCLFDVFPVSYFSLWRVVFRIEGESIFGSLEWFLLQQSINLWFIRVLILNLVLLQSKKPFQRVNVDEVEFVDNRLEDNSYWAKV